MRYRPLTLVIGLSLMLLTTFFLLITTLVAAPAPPIYWYPANTGLPANVESRAAAPLSLTVLYAGAWGEGVYRSTDHGATWQPANASITLPLRIQGGLAVNPVTPTILYAGDYYGNGGLYRSENGGDSWTLSLPGAAVRDVAVHTLTPTIVLLADWQHGLYRSTNAGNTWDPVTATLGFTATSARALAFAPATPEVAYVGAANYVFSSSDAGQSWLFGGALPSSVQALAVHPVTPSIVYAGALAHGLHRSNDGGNTWTLLTNGLPSDAWVTSLAIHPISPTVLYAGTWAGRVYQSQDSGDSWADLGYLGYVYDVLIHPQAPSVIYAATSNNGVFRGSTLDHLTIASINNPQYVHRSFPITVTARDELGIPLTGPSRTELSRITRSDPALAKTLAGSGYDGTASLLDRTASITPTLMTFADGVAVAEVTIAAEAVSDMITAMVSGGPSVVSNPFDVIWAMRLYLPVVSRD